MSALHAGTDLPPPPPPPPPGPGASLRTARERAGLSLDQVAQALKLAPRQVKALEDEDFAQLPGRTFARGFVRNYARLLKLDGDDLLAQLPDVARAPALAAPSLQSTGATMGEVPVAKIARSAFGRWLIPLALVACVVAAGAYEWYRSGRSTPNEAARSEPPAPTVQATAPSAGTARSELANPLAGAPVADPATAERRENPSAAAAPESQTAAPTTQPSSATPAAPATVPAAAGNVQVAAAPAAEAQSAPPIVLTYRASAWTQVRDGKGQTIFVRVVPAGSEQAIRGTPPFDLVIGNARAVTLVYRGNPVDLGRYTQQNVARLRLQ
jgi:cytoskeleton protein RodZ